MGLEQQTYRLDKGWQLKTELILTNPKIYKSVVLVRGEEEIEIPLVLLRNIVADEVRQARMDELHHMSGNKLLGLQSR